MSKAKEGFNVTNLTKKNLYKFDNIYQSRGLSRTPSNIQDLKGFHLLTIFAKTCTQMSDQVPNIYYKIKIGTT